jgi:hypothetical protein
MKQLFAAAIIAVFLLAFTEGKTISYKDGAQISQDEFVRVSDSLAAAKSDWIVPTAADLQKKAVTGRYWTCCIDRSNDFGIVSASYVVGTSTGFKQYAAEEATFASLILIRQNSGKVERQ